MKPALRRVLLFVAMVVAGLAVVLVFQEDAPSAPPAVYGKGGRDEGALGVVDEGGETRVTMGYADFDVHGEVEVAPGRFEERPLYRVRLQDGRLVAPGEYEVREPHITFLDGLTGAVRGELLAARGRLHSRQAGGRLRFDLADGFQLDEFVLRGDVRGMFPFEEGPPGTMQAEELHVEQGLVTAPGLVTFRRGELSLSGLDLRWDEEAGVITYERDTVVTLAATGGRPGAEVHGPGGLRWHLTPDEGQGWGELFGPVTGHADDGSRLAGERLLVSADAEALTLEGDALLEIPRGERVWRLAAPSILAARGEDGRLALARARGGVRLDDLSRPPEQPAWLETDELFEEGGVLHAPGPVVAASDGLLLRGHELGWDQHTGHVTLQRDVHVEGGPGAAEILRGSQLEAPGGLRWETLGEGEGPAAGRGELHGGVTGRLADGSRVAARSLHWDGPSGTLRLLDDVDVQRPGPGVHDTLAARAVELHVDPEAGLTAASATGDVRLTRLGADGEPLHASSERLDIAGDLLTSPDLVHLSKGDLAVSGRGLRYDERAGLLRLQRDVLVTLQRPEEGGELRLAAVALHWVLPEDRAAGFAAGHGDLVGPVTGTAPGGRSLRAGRAELDGGTRTVRLFGDARVRGEDGALLRSEHLAVTSRPEGLLVGSPVLVEWEQAAASGRGTGLLWDEAAGLLRLERDVVLVLAEAGAEALRVSGDGPLVWNAPPGAADAFAEGRGELVGDVRGEGRDGLAFRTPRLLLDGPARSASFVGPSQLGALLDGEPLELSATERVHVVQDAAGNLQRVEALGDVVGSLGSEPPLALRTGHLVADAAQGLTTMEGETLVARGDLHLRTGPGGRLEVYSDAAGRVQRVRATGRVTVEAGELSATGDWLEWDVEGDHVVLEGDVRLAAPGMWQIVPRAELWPRQRRWFTPPATTVVEGER